MSKALLVDLYELAMAGVYFKHKRDTLATFDLFIRSSKRPFYIACGIDDALDYLQSLRFAKEDIDYLNSLALFEDDFLDYLKEFKFKGEVFGVCEPEIVFAGEPILRVRGNLIEAQIIESALLNRINLATTLATKAARVVLAAKERSVYDFSLRRAQGSQASLVCAKYAYIVGAKGTSNVYAGFLYKIPVVGTMAHSYVMSFEKEAASFLSFAKTFPTKAILLVDTYDVKGGISSAVRVANFLKRKGIKLLGIRLDSGNLVEDSKYARKILDREGLSNVTIFVSGNLDEYKISWLIKEKAPIDAFGVGTNMGCSSDLPYTDVIYKLVEVKGAGRSFIPTMKLSAGKTTLPSRKQVFRVFNEIGCMRKDIIALDGEAQGGKKLLRKLMNGGRRLYKEKDINEKRKVFKEKIKTLPFSSREVKDKVSFPVVISKKLSLLTKTLKKEVKRRISAKAIFMDIDTQNDFLKVNGALYVEGSRGIVNNLKKLTNFALKKGILIISSQDTHERRDLELREFPPHCLKGTQGQEKIKETLLSKYMHLTFKKMHSLKRLETIASAFPQIILEKNTFNLFSNLNTANLLEVIFPEQVVVYGVVTEYCVKEAVEGLIKSGFRVVIVEDAICEISSKERDKLFFLWRKNGVKFMTTKTLLETLSWKINSK
ncbi:MAG: nicotinate phosphoribosyltransferase [Candidatus Omnitrophota bacterium]